MILDTSATIRAVLGEAISSTQPEFLASYADITASAFTPGAQSGAMNGTTQVTVVSSPSSDTRTVKQLSICNNDDIDHTITIVFHDGTNERTLVDAISVSAGSTLTWTLHGGWFVQPYPENLTPEELAQLQNIGNVTISNAQWAFLGGLDQDVATSASPTFAGLTVNGNIVVTGTVDGVDVAALKTDVDGFPDALKNLAAGEIGQLENIGATTISGAQWGFLGAMGGQPLESSDIGSSVQAWDASLDTYVANSLTAGELAQLQNINAETITVAQWGYLGGATSFGGSVLTGTEITEAMLSSAVQTKLNNTAPSKFDATAAPTANDDESNTAGNGTFDVGSVWIDVTNNEAYRCVDATTGAAIWIETTLETGELGTMATQDANAVNVTGGDITGITDLAVADGGTGASTAAAARSNLAAQIADSALDTLIANPLAAGELSQLQNINNVTISNTQWGYLGAMDQGVSTGDDVSFNALDGTPIGDTTPAAGDFTTLSASGEAGFTNGINFFGSKDATFPTTPALHIAGVGSIHHRSADAFNASPNALFHRSRGSVGSETVVQDGDRIGGFTFRGWSGVAGGYSRCADLVVEVGGTVDSGGVESVPGRWSFQVNAVGSTNSPSEAMGIESDGGVTVGSPTGGSQGAGTINAEGVYDDGTLLTCYVFDQALDDTVDAAKWDDLVPDRVEPARTEENPLTETVTEERVVDEWDEAQGGYVRRVKQVETERPVYNEFPVVDENGDPVLDDEGDPVVKRIERTETVEIPEKVEPRQHDPLRKFRGRIGTKHDPLDLDKYAAHWKEKRHLTSMPNEANYDPVNGKLGIGEWTQRLVETVEIQAVLIEQLNHIRKDQAERIDDLEARIAALES